ncbi:ribosome recycling factor, partial [Listeria monocytogenes]|nr:ribosome recycling factor [Listeria monocytogenes]
RSYGEDVQKLTDESIKNIDSITKDKEAEILEV